MPIESTPLRARESISGLASAPQSTGHPRADGALVSGVLRGAALSDEGETCDFLLRQIGARRLPLRARRTIEGICRMNEVELEKGRVIVRLPSTAAREVREGLDRLGRVCARISRLKVAAAAR